MPARCRSGATRRRGAPTASMPSSCQGSPFTAPRATNERSWLYRIRPTVSTLGAVREGRHRPVAHGACAEVDVPIGPMRWDPIADSGPEAVASSKACARSRRPATPARRRAWERMSISSPRRWRTSISTMPTARCCSCRSKASCGFGPSSASSTSRRARSRVIPRGVKIRVELIDGPARGYICENYGGAFTLPERGPIGANCLANPRDFLTPVAAYEDRDAPCQMFVKWGGTLCGHRARPFAARRGRLARQLRALQVRSAPFLAGRADPVRPRRPVDLHRTDLAVGDAGHRQRRLRDLPASAGWWPRTPSARPGTT